MIIERSANGRLFSVKIVYFQWSYTSPPNQLVSVTIQSFYP